MKWGRMDGRDRILSEWRSAKWIIVDVMKWIRLRELECGAQYQVVSATNDER